ncbi:transcriptional regulator with XRE-family HTH domain [Oxalobacteraceae bacterium GrIS 1.11]
MHGMARTWSELTKSQIRDKFSIMENQKTASGERRLAQRLRQLRAERNWSLDQLATLSKVSRATLSRLENAEVSPTTSVLGKLCTAYGLTMSRLMRLVEDDFIAVLPRTMQMLWSDPSAGFRRRGVSPPARTLAGEVVECELEAGMRIAYDDAPRQGLEHHLILIDGQLEVTVDGQSHALRPGDCLRYQLFGPSAFATPAQCGARYFLFIL